ANAVLTENNTITFQAGLSGAINLQTALDAIVTGDGFSTTITGPAAATGSSITVCRGPGILAHFSIVTVAAGASVTVQNLGIRDGLAENGGGIVNNGQLSMSSCQIGGNSSMDGKGGGIYNGSSAILNLTDVTVSENVAAASKAELRPGACGGGIYNAPG